MNEKLKILTEFCNKNIKSMSKVEELEKFLPIEDEKLKIFIMDGKMFFQSGEKLSYIWNEDNYYSHLEILKRIGAVYGVSLNGEDIFAVALFYEKISELIKRGN